MRETAARHPEAGRVELWFMDEARVGQKGGVTHVWHRKGARPRGLRQQGFASAEPYIYKNEVPEWGKDVKYQLVNDAGFPKYAAMVSVRPDNVTAYADCLTALVPAMQQAEIDYYDGTTLDATNALILDLVDQYDTGWVYSQGVADYSVKTQLADGIISNGPDATLGNFDDARVAELFDIVSPIFDKQDITIADGLAPTDLYTNKFVDMSLGLK